MFEVSAAAASVSGHGEDQNEDRVGAFGTAELARAGAVICDGVGSAEGSAEIAAQVRDLAMDQLRGAGVEAGIWQLGGMLAGATLAGDGQATTLLAISTDESGLVGHALVGNGSIIELEASRPRPELVRLRWTDVVLPQMDWSEGRPVLRSFVDAGGAVEVAKGLRETPPGQMRIYLACSDGIASDEERAQGAASDERVWKEVPRQLVRVLDRLGGDWDRLAEAPAGELGDLLGAALAETLDQLLAEDLIDDDSSLAAVLVRPRPLGESPG
ncbi:MAG: hypothetical protein QOE75_1913 [Solirubrobacterales bacterium]|jgi:hypothetical protein|nr:hypothetical protein [Solirubrobacterales bacterium]